MDGIQEPICPSCGRFTVLSRTEHVDRDYFSVQTHGCRECGLWVATQERLTRHSLAATLCPKLHRAGFWRGSVQVTNIVAL